MEKIFFRFFFLFFFLCASPWWIFYDIPGVSYLLNLYGTAEGWVVNLFNTHLLHVKEVLNRDGGGSGDTSYAWAQFYTMLILSGVGSLVWTLIDRKRETPYHTLGLVLRNSVRYYLALMAFGYGIMKLFALQMSFPNLSQLATPLGDFLPMRFSWMFIGYSTTYQVFSGVVETLVGILLLNRRTVTLGALLAVGAFANVFILNLSYDIPVKLFSMQLLIYSLFLSAEDGKRLFKFFWLNQEAPRTTLYEMELTKKWQRIARIVLKLAFVVMFAVLPFYDFLNRYREEAHTGDMKPIKAGLYEIETFIKNNDTIPILYNDLAWKDFIFDQGGLGSVNTVDSLFRQRYRRGYFNYQPDSVTEMITFKRFSNDSSHLFQMRYQLLDDRTLVLWGKVRADSLYFRLHRSDRHFQLAERQFHWISESNR